MAKPEYKVVKKGQHYTGITKDGHTMFLEDAVKDLKAMQQKIAELESGQSTQPPVDLNKATVQMRIIRHALFFMNRADAKWQVKHRPNWAIVRDILTGHTSKGGSTSAADHCKWLGIADDGKAFKDMFDV